MNALIKKLRIIFFCRDITPYIIIKHKKIKTGKPSMVPCAYIYMPVYLSAWTERKPKCKRAFDPECATTLVALSRSPFCPGNIFV